MSLNIQLLNQYPLVVTLIALIVLTFIFWSLMVKAIGREPLLFDQWFGGLILGVAIARFVAIIIDWEFFNSLPYFYLPYERYGDERYYFRLMPWRLLNPTVSFFSPIGMIFGFTTFSYIYGVFLRKMNLRKLFLPLVTGAASMLALVAFIESRQIVLALFGVLLTILVPQRYMQQYGLALWGLTVLSIWQYFSVQELPTLERNLVYITLGLLIYLLLHYLTRVFVSRNASADR